MKKFIYIIIVLIIAGVISFAVGQFLKNYLEVTKLITNLDSLMNAIGFLWQFLLLGFVIGGVIFTIPRNQHNEDYLQISGMLCVLGSCSMIVAVGFGIFAKGIYVSIEGIIALVSAQIGLTLFYAGIAITIIEIVREIYRKIRSWCFM